MHENSILLLLVLLLLVVLLQLVLLQLVLLLVVLLQLLLVLLLLLLLVLVLVLRLLLKLVLDTPHRLGSHQSCPRLWESRGQLPRLRWSQLPPLPRLRCRPKSHLHCPTHLMMMISGRLS